MRREAGRFLAFVGAESPLVIVTLCLPAACAPAGVTLLDVADALNGSLVRLRAPRRADVPGLAEIRGTPEVHSRWRGGRDMAAAVAEDLDEPGSTAYVIELEGRVIGWIQWSSEEEPDYRYASIDIYLDPAVHGRGIGSDAVRTLARHLISDHRYHRLEIDPAVDNVAAICCYTKVGFRPVGVRRRSERGNDGTWHDALLMDLLAEELLEEGRVSDRTSHGRRS